MALPFRVIAVRFKIGAGRKRDQMDFVGIAERRRNNRRRRRPDPVEQFAMVALKQRLHPIFKRVKYRFLTGFYKQNLGVIKHRIVWVTNGENRYSITRNSRFQRILAQTVAGAGSIDIQTKTALPTMWSFGTKPQYRESSELWRLSPIMK